MTMACLCDVMRPGLAEALAIRGVDVRHAGRRAIAGLRPPAGSVLVVATPAGDPAMGELRRVWAGPMLALLGEGEQADVARALDEGADDAVTDRAETPLIAARVAALARRNRRYDMIEIGSLTIDPIARRVFRDGCLIPLLPREYALLLQLAHRPGTTVTRGALRKAVWGYDFDPGTNVIEVHVSRLRAKLDRGFGPPIVLTERGCGYRLAAE